MMTRPSRLKPSTKKRVNENHSTGWSAFLSLAVKPVLGSLSSTGEFAVMTERLPTLSKIL